MPTTKRGAKRPTSKTTRGRATKSGRKPRNMKLVPPATLAERIAQSPDTPLLELAAPQELDRDTQWGDNLQAIIDNTHISPDILAEAIDVGRSTVYAWMKGERGSNIKQPQLQAMAKVIGIPPEAWFWDRARLIDWIRENYPAYNYNFNPDAGAENGVSSATSTWSKGFNPAKSVLTAV